MAGKADIAYMRRALELATKGRGMTYPNPLVGALLVKNGRVVGEGYHRRVGGDHAEVVAIRAAGTQAKGATLYVTLEPCCHTGRTGPCTEAIIKAGIKRVVFPSKDPDPRVNGQGAARLRKAGVLVSTGLFKQDADKLNEAYFHHHRTGLPFVILKLAQSLDGRIATCTGDAEWISGIQSRKYVHRLRSEVGAVLIGGETARRDDPALTVRHVKGMNPYRIILSRDLELAQTLRLISANQDGKTILASSERGVVKYLESKPKSNLIYWTINSTGDGNLDLRDLLAKAGSFGIRSILVEGGSQLATSFLRERLVHKVVLVMAPKLIGKGIDSFGDLGVREMSSVIEFEKAQFESSGQDWIFVGYPKGGK